MMPTYTPSTRRLSIDLLGLDKPSPSRLGQALAELEAAEPEPGTPAQILGHWAEELLELTELWGWTSEDRSVFENALESALERTPRGTYEWVPEWDRGTTTEEDALCARAQAWLDEHLPASVEVRVRGPKKGEARGIYKRTGGKLRILGFTIPVPEELDEALAQAWEQAWGPEEV
jgi:hypothetical protein